MIDSRALALSERVDFVFDDIRRILIYNVQLHGPAGMRARIVPCDFVLSRLILVLDTMTSRRRFFASIIETKDHRKPDFFPSHHTNRNTHMRTLETTFAILGIA